MRGCRAGVGAGTHEARRLTRRARLRRLDAWPRPRARRACGRSRCRCFLRSRISFGVTSTSSSSSMKSSACSSVYLIGGRQLDRSRPCPTARMLVSCLALSALTVRSLSLRVDADELAFVHLVAFGGEQLAALLQRTERVRGRHARRVGDHHAVLALGDLAGFASDRNGRTRGTAGPCPGSACGTRSGSRSGRAPESCSPGARGPCRRAPCSSAGALRSPSFSITPPWCCSSMSTTSCSNGSHRLAVDFLDDDFAGATRRARSLRGACSRSAPTGAARRGRRPGTCPGPSLPRPSARRCAASRAAGARGAGGW